jgi:3-dehydroquinate dehydratase
MSILLLQGADIVALGKRQPEICGTTTAAEREALFDLLAERTGSAATTLSPSTPFTV